MQRETEATAPRVLCVDDEPPVLDGLSRHRRRRFALATSVSGDAALETLAREGPFAVVVSDLRMPGGTASPCCGGCARRRLTPCACCSQSVERRPRLGAVRRRARASRRHQQAKLRLAPRAVRGHDLLVAVALGAGHVKKAQGVARRKARVRRASWRTRFARATIGAVKAETQTALGGPST